jgi:HD-like signal output (HDOD) protein
MTRYTACLLHDIGKLVLDQYIASASPLFYRQLIEEKARFSQADKKILGVDHTEAGYNLALKWSLPASFIDSIRDHHAPENADRNVELTYIFYLADLIMFRFHIGLELACQSTAALPSRLRTVGFSIEKFSEILDSIPIEVFQSGPAPMLTQ